MNQILQDALALRELLSDEKRWTKGVLALDAGLFDVHPVNDKATCWCLVGATAKVTGLAEEHPTTLDYAWMKETELGRLLGEATKRRGFNFAWVFNDDGKTTHADVMSLIDDVVCLAGG